MGAKVKLWLDCVQDSMALRGTGAVRKKRTITGLHGRDEGSVADVASPLL